MWRFAFILALLLGCTFSRHLESTKRTTDEKDSSADIEEYGAVEKPFDPRDIYLIGGPVIGAVVALSLMSWIITKCLGKKTRAEGAKGKGADTNGKVDTKLRPQNTQRMYTTSEVCPSAKQSRRQLESASANHLRREKSHRKSKSSSIIHTGKVKREQKSRSASKQQQERGKFRSEQRSASIQQQERGKSHSETKPASIQHQPRQISRNESRSSIKKIAREQSLSASKSNSNKHPGREQSRSTPRIVSFYHPESKSMSPSIHHQEREQSPSKVRSSFIDRKETSSIRHPKRKQPPSKLTYTPIHHSGREYSQGKLRTISVIEPRREQAPAANTMSSSTNKHSGRKQSPSKYDTKKENGVREIYEQADFKEIQNELKQTQSKMADLCSQFSSLRQELKASRKVLSQESGENVHKEGVLNANSGWRGRSQQKTSLQAQQDLRELSAFPPGPLQQPSVAIQPHGEPTVWPLQTQLPPVQQPTMEQSSYAYYPPILPVGQTIVGQSTQAFHPPPPAGQPTVWQSTYTLPQPPPVGQPGVCQSTPSIPSPPPVGQPTVWQSTHSLPLPPQVIHPTAWQSTHAPLPPPPVCQSEATPKSLTMYDLLNSPVFKKSFEKRQSELSAKKSLSAKMWSSDQTS